MNSTEIAPRSPRRDTFVACSIIFFAIAVLCVLLGWADGVRHGHAYLQFPKIDGFMIGAALMAVIGIVFLLWSRAAKRG